MKIPAAALVLTSALLAACTPAAPPRAAYPDRVVLDGRNLILGWADGRADCTLAPPGPQDRYAERWEFRPLGCPGAPPGMSALVSRDFSWTPTIEPVYVETPPPRLTGLLDLRGQSTQLRWAVVTIFGTEERAFRRHTYAVYYPGPDFIPAETRPAPPEAPETQAR